VEARALDSGAHPALQVKPTHAAIGRPVTISGRHLRPGAFYTLLLVVPNAQKPKARALFPELGRTDASGRFSLRATMPVVTQCGPAMIFATAARASHPVTVRFSLTGCKASSNPKGPPPPPTSKKKRKKP
jgi:hypothetical protein